MSWKRKENGWWQNDRIFGAVSECQQKYRNNAKKRISERKELWEIHRTNDIGGNMENKLQKVQYLGNKKSAGDPLKVK